MAIDVTRRGNTRGNGNERAEEPPGEGAGMAETGRAEGTEIMGLNSAGRAGKEEPGKELGLRKSEEELKNLGEELCTNVFVGNYGMWWD